MPARWSAPPAACSRVIFHDLFGACRVRLPLLMREKLCVLNATPSAPGPGMCRLLAGSVRHTSSRARGGASAWCVSTPGCCGKPVMWNMYMSAEKNSSLARAVCAALIVSSMRSPWMTPLTAKCSGTVVVAGLYLVRGGRCRSDTPPGPVNEVRDVHAGRVAASTEQTRGSGGNKEPGPTMDSTRVLADQATWRLSRTIPLGGPGSGPRAPIRECGGERVGNQVGARRISCGNELGHAHPFVLGSNPFPWVRQVIGRDEAVRRGVADVHHGPAHGAGWATRGYPGPAGSRARRW